MEEAAQAIGLLNAGLSLREVGRRLNVSHSVISRLRERHQQTGSVKQRPRSGRPKKTTPRQDRQMVVLAKRERVKSAKMINSEFRNATGVRISDQTVRNRLHSHNLRAFRPAVRPRLTMRHRTNRLEFARLHVNLDRARLRNILFTDESRFCLDFHDGRRRVWRSKNERYANCNVVEHDRFGGGSIMVWGGISLDGSTDLYVIRNGSLNALRYRDEILDPIVRPFAGAIGDDFILMDDNARPHRARIVNDYLARESIVRMEWPAYSPDLNPIEHAWDVLQTRISALPVSPTTINELADALVQEWRQIPQQVFQNLVLSFTRRCQAVINARGGHTRY